MKLTTDNILSTVSEVQLLLEQNRKKLTDDDIDDFIYNLEDMLTKYKEKFGEDCEFKYIAKKRFDKIDVKLIFECNQFNPLMIEKKTFREKREVIVSNLLINKATTIVYRYINSKNIILIRSPRFNSKKVYFKKPMFLFVIFGIIFGFICRALPDNISNTITTSIVSPASSILLNLIAAVSIPFIFLTLITSLSAMQDINEMASKGFKYFRHIVATTLYAILITSAVSLLLYSLAGEKEITMQNNAIFDLFFGLIPTSIFTPFVEGNLSQILVLGFIFSAALLILGDRVAGLKNIINQLQQLSSTILSVVLICAPLIPFLNLTKTIANGDFQLILKGWQFIVVVYISFVIYVLYKFIKISIRTKTNMLLLFKKVKKPVFTSFSHASATVSLNMCIKQLKTQFGVSENFTSIYFPMQTSLQQLQSAITFTAAAFFFADIYGYSVSLLFLVTSIIIVLQLSISGATATVGWTTILSQLNMPTDNVGILSVFKVAYENFAKGSVIFFAILDHLDVAYKNKEIDINILHSKETLESLKYDTIRTH